MLEWPGWTSDSQVNFAMVRCRVKELVPEYEDFFCQALEHIAREEAAEARAGVGDGDAAVPPAPRICVVGAGHAAVLAMRALQTLRGWRGSEGGADPALDSLESLVMLAPTWRMPRYGLLARFLPPERASRLIGMTLHSDTRLSRIFQGAHFSARRFKRHFAHHRSPGKERLKAVAEWFFQRPRPYVQTDAAALCGLLDPPGVEDAGGLAAEVAASAGDLRSGVLVVSTEVAGGRPHPSKELASALAARDGQVRCIELTAQSALPHESDTSAVQFALDGWLGDARQEPP